jgi:hypothetical protein
MKTSFLLLFLMVGSSASAAESVDCHLWQKTSPGFGNCTLLSSTGPEIVVSSVTLGECIAKAESLVIQTFTVGPQDDRTCQTDQVKYQAIDGNFQVEGTVRSN